MTGLDCIGIPVVQVCRPNSRSLAVSQGKGTRPWTPRARRGCSLFSERDVEIVGRLGETLRAGSVARDVVGAC